MNYLKLAFLALLGWIAYVTFNKIRGRSTINSQVLETEREHSANDFTNQNATAARNGATPAMATIGRLPLVGAILNPFLSGGNISPAEILPAYGIQPWQGTSPIPQTNQPLRN